MPDTMERVCFLLTLRPDRIEDYLAAHATVWPEMLAALRAAGWRNYSLFLRPEDGLVVGYLETQDFARAQAAMAATEVNARWQASMAEYFQASPFSRVQPDARPDESVHRLAEYFHLD
ncbi:MULTISPECIES: L-rhamnose mutarotase [Nocardia]|uniref:L-rhamnose mutarotase n=1 Tax=Nocardia implantans TaxID=3108168 RepID=A0ABU6AU23_9NOCA|nr:MULTISPECIES: L-rhamnose mutarotase [unclassified Nocardia]MEA3530638.1 L-rhamnose mutarotase [Nocardia sp. CDC192]MEB3510987.1 L-rhamnose mutarotase [Nocardia sp. CDC186]